MMEDRVTSNSPEGKLLKSPVWDRKEQQEKKRLMFFFGTKKMKIPFSIHLDDRSKVGNTDEHKKSFIIHQCTTVISTEWTRDLEKLNLNRKFELRLF